MTENRIVNDQLIWITLDAEYRYNDKNELVATGNYFIYWSYTEPSGLLYGELLKDENG